MVRYYTTQTLTQLRVSLLDVYVLVYSINTFIGRRDVSILLHSLWVHVDISNKGWAMIVTRKVCVNIVLQQSAGQAGVIFL